MSPKFSNYDRVCVECASYRPGGKGSSALTAHMCDRPVDVVTGAPLPVRCSTARSAYGHCGPQGRNYSSAGVVVRPTREAPAARAPRLRPGTALPAAAE